MSSSKPSTSKKRKPSLTLSGPVSKNSSTGDSINSSSGSISTSKPNTATVSGASRSGGSGGSSSSSSGSHHVRTPSSSKLSATSKTAMMSSATGRPTEQQHKQQQQQQQQQQHQQHQQQNQQYGKKTSLVTAAALADAHVERDRKPKVLLHELAAQKYSLFLAESPGLGHLPPLSYYRRPRRKRQRPDMTKALVTLRVPGAPLDGSHTLHFTSEWRKPMTIEPEQLGAFYKPGDGVIEPTLQPPPDLRMGGIQGKDLNHGYLNYVEPDTTSSTSEIAEMLDETPGLEREEESAHFITYRNNLNKIMVTPYSKQKWEIEVFKEGGVIYLEVVMTDRNKGKMDRTSYWGRRFETLCVLGVEGARLDELQRGPDDPPRPSYCALYRSRIGNHNVLMGAEIDACRPSDPGRFVEIKTTRVIHNPKDEQIFKKHKTLKYWAQCYLAGVRDLVVGYRDDHGIVRDVKTWTTDALVDSVDKVKHWDKDVCLNFTDRVLSFLKDNVDEGPRYSMKLLDPYDQITLEQIASPSTPTAPGAVGGSLYAER